MRALTIIIVGLVALSLASAREATHVADSTILSTAVSNIFRGPCNWAVEVDDPTGFAPGDRVLLHQAQGALCAQAAEPDSGNIISNNLAGAFEFNWVRSVFRNRVFLSDSIGVDFEVQHSVQLVKVIRADSLVLTGVVKPRAWDGRSGGVVVVEAMEWILCDGCRIDASATGFRGGDMSADDFTCTLATDMHAPAPSAQYGSKGEGISLFRTGAEAGRAAVANGGGGGGNHNSGGGGGGGAGAGGRGGLHWAGCPGLTNTYGVGGFPTALDPADPRLFLGGGGGGAHQDEERQGSNGGRGGGAALVRAPIIEMKSAALVSTNGEDVTILAQHNGAAGGGGGGTILLVCDVLTGAANLQADGGHGGDIDASDRFHTGPGGGGGGGHIATTLPSINASFSVTTLKGRSGVNQGRIASTATWYSQPGDRGRVTTDIQLAVRPPTSGILLVSDGDRDLGLLRLGSTFQTRFVVWNFGDAPALITGILFLERRLREVLSEPLPPVTLFKGDSLVVIAEGTVMGGEEVDSLVLDVNNICGVVPIITAARSWHATLDTTCVAIARVVADSMTIGDQGSIHVVLDPEHTVLAGMRFRMGLSANRTVLHLRGATVSPPEGVQCSVVDYWESGDTAILVVEGEILPTPQANIDTLFSVSVLPLFGQLSSTSVGTVSSEPLSFTPDCSALLVPAQVGVGEVCSSRPVRMVVFGQDDRTAVRSEGNNIVIEPESGSSSPAVEWEIHSLHGSRVGKGNTAHGPQRTVVVSGVYAVTLWFNGASRTVLLLH